MKQLSLLLSLITLFSCTRSESELSKVSKHFTAYQRNEKRQLFEDIQESLQGKRILLLGETGHGDGSAFELKSEIVDYLNKHDNWEILALEGGSLFSLYLADNNLPIHKKIGVPTLEQSWFYIWSNSNEVSQLKEIAKNQSMNILGIEPIFDFYSAAYFYPFIIKNVEISPDYKKRLKALRKIQTQLFKSTKNKSLVSIDELIDFEKGINNLKDSVITWDIAHQAMILQQISNIESNLPKYKNYILNQYTFENESIAIEKRDAQMFSNLEWILEQYPNKKIIIWGANFHITKDISEFEYNKPEDKNWYQRAQLFGMYVNQKYGNESFSLGLIKGEGTSGTVFRSQVDTFSANETSLEYELLKNKSMYYGLLNTSTLSLPYKNMEIESSVLGTKKGKLFKGFDGILFQRNMKAATNQQKNRQ
ncbi:MAG: erythromycin esterase family protein [Flavobacteriales bacterium]|jgi:hypothetical protein|nr:erythromycin esterase family protein [Flavobacteriales bacterium]